jgi:hypothetical protein
MKVSDFVREEALGILKRDTAAKSEVTRFDLMQAFTRVAHALPIDDRTKLETAVGRAFLGGAQTSVRENLRETQSQDSN